MRRCAYIPTNEEKTVISDLIGSRLKNMIVLAIRCLHLILQHALMRATNQSGFQLSATDFSPVFSSLGPYM